MPVVRFGVSVEEELLDDLDAFVKENTFANRSQAIRFLIEKNSVERKWLCNHIVAGAIVLLYDVRKSEVASQLSGIQSANAGYILSVQRLFPGDNLCLEVVAVKGTAKILTVLSDQLIAIKGIKQGKLVMSRTD